MKNILKTVATSLILLPLSTNTFAADAALSGSFKTIKDVTISQVAGQEMVINGLQMASGSICTVATPAVGVNWPGDTLMLASTAGTAAPAASYGATSGVGCSTGTSTPGIYEIDGSAGAVVSIELVSNSAGGINFTPAGCATDYVDAGADNDICEPLVADTPNTINLATVADETVSAGNGQPVAGKLITARLP